jgi:DNA repair protein RecO (recombination protein O)
MPLQRSELIVLRRTQLRDSSLVLTCITPTYGKISLVARGALRPGSALAEALQYFTVADVQFYHREKRSVDYISKAEATETFGGIPEDSQRYGFAAAGLEFVNLFLPEDEENREVYFLLKKYLRLVGRSDPRQLERELLHFWLLLTIFAGYAPQLDRCACGNQLRADSVKVSPELGGLVCDDCAGQAGKVIRLDMGTLMVLRRLSETDIDAKGKIDLSQRQIAAGRSLLTALTEYHVGRQADLKSFTFLRKLKLIETDGGSSGKETE